jgi:hypothetical protein
MEPKTTNYGKTMNIISTQTKVSLIIETPLMDNFGIEDGERNNVHDGKFKIKLTSKKETNSRIGMFLDKMTALDNTLIDAAFTNNWLGVGVTRQEIEKKFKPIFNKNNSDNNPANFAFVKATVPNFDGKWDNLHIYDKENRILFPNENGDSPPSIVPRNSRVACCLNITQIWIRHDKKEWGCSLKLVQCVVIRPTLPAAIFKPRQFQLSDEDMADTEEMS